MVDLIVFSDDSIESRVAQDLIPYFKAVIEEVSRHVPEKGYGYKEPEAQKFMILWLPLYGVTFKVFGPKNTRGRGHEATIRT